MLPVVSMLHDNEWLLKRNLIDSIAADRKESTVKAYLTAVKELFVETGKHYTEITSQDITDFLAIKQHRDHIGQNYKSTLYRYFSTFFQWAYRNDYIKEDIMKKVARVKCVQKKKERFTDEEIEDIKDACETLKEKALIELLFSTGMLNTSAVKALRKYINSREYCTDALFIADRNYNLITDVTNQVQQTLNEDANIGIKSVTPKLNQDRIDGIINRVSSEDYFDDVAWLLDEPVKNFSQSIVDNAIRENAEFHSKAGMSPKIVRKLAGGCCDWCRAVAGTYSYPDVPKDVYRRHQRCRCTVDYHPGSGKVQNVHSKQWKTQEERDKIEARIIVGLVAEDGIHIVPDYPSKRR